MDESETYTMQETREKLGVSRQTIYAMIAREQLTRYTKPYRSGQGGQRVLFSREQVDALATKVIPVPPITKGKGKAKKKSQTQEKTK